MDLNPQQVLIQIPHHQDKMLVQWQVTLRLKENIAKVGSSPSGINIYEWNYKSAPDTRYRGVMAQEIMKTHPDAIHLFEDGYMGVHYSHLDVNMEVVK